MVKRVFIVGCPRSGTTLLQGILAAHPRILSFPETHFFSMAFPRNRVKRRLTWPAFNVRKVLEEFLEEVKRPDLMKEASIGLLERDFEKPFVRVLDRLTLDAGKDIWIEKTPRHLHFIDEIKQRIPDARFIHIFRDGRDVVTSLYRITNADPSKWNRKRAKKGLGIEECVRRWNSDLMITARYMNTPGHYPVNYHELVEDPEKAARGLCSFLGIDFMPEMIDSKRSFASIVRSDEPWKEKNARPVQKQESAFESVFTTEQRAFIEKNLIKPDFMRTS